MSNEWFITSFTVVAITMILCILVSYIRISINRKIAKSKSSSSSSTAITEFEETRRFDLSDQRTAEAISDIIEIDNKEYGNMNITSIFGDIEESGDQDSLTTNGNIIIWYSADNTNIATSRATYTITKNGTENENNKIKQKIETVLSVLEKYRRFDVNDDYKTNKKERDTADIENKDNNENVNEDGDHLDKSSYITEVTEFQQSVENNHIGRPVQSETDEFDDDDSE